MKAVDALEHSPEQGRDADPRQGECRRLQPALADRSRASDHGSARYLFAQYDAAAGNTGVQRMGSVGPSSVSAAAFHTA